MSNSVSGTTQGGRDSPTVNVDELIQLAQGESEIPLSAQDLLQQTEFHFTNNHLQTLGFEYIDQADQVVERIRSRAAAGERLAMGISE